MTKDYSENMRKQVGSIQGKKSHYAHFYNTPVYAESTLIHLKKKSYIFILIKCL